MVLQVNGASLGAPLRLVKSGKVAYFASMPNLPRIARRLREARENRKLSQTALSAITGISGPQLCRYEAGFVLPRAENLKLLAEALEVSTDWLLGVGE